MRIADRVLTTDHIFICGLGRTGSTLTRTILNASPEVGLGGESHFLRDLPRLGFQTRPSFRAQLARIGSLMSDSGVEKITDYIYKDQPRHYYFWRLRDKGINREEFRRRLLDSDRSERALFNLAMETHAGGKSVRGDKTPAHIFHVPTLLEWYPNSKVIHTFRDPRAIFTSRKKKAERNEMPAFNRMLRRLGVVFQLFSSTHVIVNWKRVVRLHRQYQAKYPDRYTLLKYEDLVCYPEETLSNLCRFLGIELTEEMLNQQVVNSSFVAKDQNVSGFDLRAVDRWREHIDPLINRWFLLWCRSELAEFGYKTE